MIGKILSHLIGNAGSSEVLAEGTSEQLIESEEGGWIIVNLPEAGSLTGPDMDPLEQMLIEHPSMSVYQMRCAMNEEEEEEEEEEQEEEEEDVPGTDEDISRPVAGAPLISWHAAAWGIPLPCSVHLLTIQRARNQSERKKLGRSAIHRQNRAKARFSMADRRYGHFKQPCQRLYNY